MTMMSLFLWFSTISSQDLALMNLNGVHELLNGKFFAQISKIQSGRRLCGGGEKPTHSEVEIDDVLVSLRMDPLTLLKI